LPDVYDVGRRIQCDRASCQPESKFCAGGQDRDRETPGFGRQRGWNNIRLLSSGQSSFNADFDLENDKGQNPGVSVFSREPDGKIHHFYTTEASLRPAPNGNPNHRGIDLFTPVWNLFDLLPEGRENWSPKLSY